MVDFKDKIKAYYRLEIEIIEKLDVDSLNEALNCLLRHFEAGSRVYIMGNGGSSATASHFVCDFNKGVCSELDKRFDFICLNDNIPTLMAVANDISFENVFLYQLEHKLKKEDLVIAISGSGNSHNVVKAVEYAKSIGSEIIAMTGYSGGKLAKLCDIHMHVPVDDMQITEDLHMGFDHMMMKILWTYLMEKDGKQAIYRINQ
ncbi:MAG: SIS domain-containing protein [Bacillota bacterium]|nr:SIS domain-containing protein [Bacillota bacterium]